MIKIKIDQQGRLLFSELNREYLDLSSVPEFWLEEKEDAYILHHRLPNVRKVYLEPTTGCNLKCRTCIRQVWEDTEAQMSNSTFQKFLSNLTDLPQLERIIFTGFGEPLAHPGIIDMIAAVRSRNLAVTIGSNGLLLDKKMCRELIKLKVDRLVISVDGVRPETYAATRGGSLTHLLNNIRLLNEAKAQMNSLLPALGIEFVALRSNVAELEDLVKLASKLGSTRVLITNVLPYTEEMKAEILYGYEPRKPLGAGSWPVKADAWVMWGILDFPRMYWGAERRCRFIKDRATVVGWDGGVSPCYALAHNYTYFTVDGRQKQVKRYLLGNINDQPLGEIWTSAEYVRFRSEVRAFNFPSCPNCDLRETCDFRERNEGCWGWNPSCADCLWAQDIIRCP
ncbi:MAG: tungsten cofactor oxidoreductase radical SAM maturase [Thermodesulfobacteriota bacterium]